MVSVATFVQRTPIELRAELFAQSGISLTASMQVSRTLGECQQIAQLVDEADQSQRARILQNIGRICAMADEAGQAALLSVVKDRVRLEKMESGHARCSWTFLRDQESFRRAEEARYTDEHRRGRRWYGVIAKAGLSLSQSPEALERFKQAIIEELRSNDVQVDIFERERASFDEKTFRVTQLTVYRDGLPQDVPEFVNGALCWQSRKPVYEAALTYESDTGVIEVVAENRLSREGLMQSFARELLGVGEHEELKLRHFDLDRLRQRRKFQTDAADGIESVRVASLRLQPIDSPGQRLTLECAADEADDIWEMAAEHLGKKDSLLVGFVVTQAKLVIQFRPDGHSRRGKKLPLIVTMPHGCDLKERTQRERLIGEKYLKRWKLLADA